MFTSMSINNVSQFYAGPKWTDPPSPSSLPKPPSHWISQFSSAKTPHSSLVSSSAVSATSASLLLPSPTTPVTSKSSTKKTNTHHHHHHHHYHHQNQHQHPNRSHQQCHKA